MTRALITQMLDVFEGMEQNYGNLWQMNLTPEGLDLLCTAAREYLAAPKQSEPDIVTRTAPEEIYLCVSDDPDDVNLPYDSHEHPYVDEGVTWSRDTPVACRVKYVRADLAAPQPTELTDAAILDIAHRKASKYTHRSDPTSHSYGFVAHTLLDFARAVLAAQKGKA